MVERQVFCVLMLAAVLAAVPVADVDPGTLHRRLASVASDVYVMTQADHGRNLERSRRGTKDVFAVVLFDKDRAAKPQADRSGDPDRTERLVRKVQ
jgi:hypothetical protein